VVEVQPLPIPHCKLHEAARTVGHLLHDVLGLVKAVANVGEECVALKELAVQGHHPSQSRPIGCQGGRRVTVDHLKRRSLERCLVAGVVAVFGPWQPPQPLPRPITRQATQVDVQDPVGDLRLPICLGVEGRAETQLDTGEGEEFRPKLAGKDGIAIAHN